MRGLKMVRRRHRLKPVKRLPPLKTVYGLRMRRLTLRRLHRLKPVKRLLPLKTVYGLTMHRLHRWKTVQRLPPLKMVRRLKIVRRLHRLKMRALLLSPRPRVHVTCGIVGRS